MARKDFEKALSDLRNAAIGLSAAEIREIARHQVWKDEFSHEGQKVTISTVVTSRTLRVRVEVPVDVVWDRDPAASGWRSRCHLGGQWELLAYDDGRWEVRGPPIGHELMGGNVRDGEAAKAECLKALQEVQFGD
jgi:hypothetical protein